MTSARSTAPAGTGRGVEPRAAAALDELRTLVARTVDHSGHTTAIDRVLVSSAVVAEDPEPSTTGTVMALIVQGAKRIALSENMYDYRSGQYLVASVDLPVTGHYTEASVDEPALGFGLVLDPSTIASLLLDDTPRAQGRSVPAVTPSLGVADASVELLDACIRMLRLLDAPRDRDVLTPMIEREILWRLLTGPMGPTMRAIGVADSSLTHISDAVRWITDNYVDPFRVEELARSCGMSASAFHRAFRAVTTYSPIQFQKQIRLAQSRLLLMTGADDVTRIAYRVGYDSPSQFSREYRRRFGVSPGRDAALMRVDATPAPDARYAAARLP